MIDKNRLFPKWTVMEDYEHNHQYLHGPLSEYADEDLAGLSIVAEEDYTAKDIVLSSGGMNFIMS